MHQHIPLSGVAPLLCRHGLDPGNMFGKPQPNLFFLGFLLFQLCSSLVTIHLRIFSVLSLVLGAAEKSLQLVLDGRGFGLGSICQDGVCSMQYTSAVDLDIHVDVGFLDLVLGQVGDSLVNAVNFDSRDIGGDRSATER